MQLVTELAALAFLATHISAFNGILQRQGVTTLPSSKLSTSTSSSLWMSENESPEDAPFLAPSQPGTKASMLKIKVTTLENTEIMLDELLDLDNPQGQPTILTCLSHFGDFNAWEVTQQYISAIESGRIATSSPVVLVGIGSVKAATKFAQDLELEERVGGKLVLVADETGSVTEQLGCYQGWLAVDKKQKERFPVTDVNPYLKLLGMVAGFGSPGTIPNVLYGYFGDVVGNAGPEGRQWVIESILQGTRKDRKPRMTAEAFEDVSPESSLRPFELATLRAQTGLHVISNWGTFTPKDGDLLTRVGGTFIFDQEECLWEHFDQGILNYANMEDICWITEAACQGKRWVPPKSITKRREDIANFLEDRNVRLAKFEAEKAAKLAQQEAEAQAEAQAAEEEARQQMQKQAEEEERIKAEEAEMQAQEIARIQAEEEMKLQAEEDARVKAAEEEASLVQKQAQEDERVKAEKAEMQAQEMARIQAEEEMARIQAEEEMKLRAEEDVRIATRKQQASWDAEEEAAQVKASEEARLKLAEVLDQVQTEKAGKQAEDDALVQAEDEKARVDAEEEAARVEMKALEAESVLKAQQEAAVSKASAKTEAWPTEAVQRKILEAQLQDVQKQRLLEARLKMVLNGEEAPAPVDETFTEEALFEAAEQTRKLMVEVYANENRASKKKQNLNQSIRYNPSKGFGTNPEKGFGKGSNN